MQVTEENGKTDTADELMQGNALIRANLHINPENLEPEEWAKRFAEAVWIENERLSNLARLLAAMWGNPND